MLSIVTRLHIVIQIFVAWIVTQDTLHCARNKAKSFINKSNDSGPSIEPCGTAAMTYFAELK